MYRVGFYQFKPKFGEVKQNRKKVRDALERAEADLLVLPELCFTGYHFQNRAELERLAENPKDSKTLEMLIELCRRKNMHVVSGFAEKDSGKIYNSALLVGPEGLLHTYRKIHLFLNEKDYFEPGNLPLQVQEIDGVRVGTMICFDWIFPETTRILALQGADIICHPSNLVMSYCQEAMITRCLENNLFAITANRIGADERPHGTLRFTGKSQIVAPKGKLLYRSDSQKEEMFVIEIDPALARDKQLNPKNSLLNDRRPEFYDSLWKMK
jgi:predicted amidohydrolase